MDAVYICRAGENEELRYSLRSLVANIEHDRVWLFGVGPAWYAGQRVIVPQDRDKYTNARRAIAAACTHHEVSDPFILMNDDFYAIAPATVEMLDRGPVRDVITEIEEAGIGRGRYARGMFATLEFLEGRGYQDPLSFSLHVPMPVRKSVMLGALALTENMRPGMHLRTIYGALAGEPSRTVEDVKLCRLRHKAADGAWLSTDDRTFHDALETLQRLFPDRTEYEEETMKVRALKPFKDRAGGCRRREDDVFDVTEARFREINGSKYGKLVEALEQPKPDLASVKMPELRKMAAERGIKVPVGMKKVDLVDMLS